MSAGEECIVELPCRGLSLCYRVDGPEDGLPVVLLMGLGMQLVAWPQAMVDGLAQAGCRVLRLDNRDIGRSGSGPLEPHDPVALALLRHLLHRPVRPAYTLAAMAEDVLALLEALRWPAAHLVGVSMGGMIAQKAALLAPTRVASLVSMMSSAGPRTAPWPAWSVLPAVLGRPPMRAPLQLRVAHFLRLFRRIGRITDADELAATRAALEAALQRSYRPGGTSRQLLAVLAEPDRSAEVAAIRCPVSLIHGERDPLIRPAAMAHMAALLPQAQVHRVAGLAHHLPAWSVAPLLALLLAHLRAVAPGRM